MRSLNTIKYYWSNTSTLLFHLPKNSRYLLLGLICSKYLLTSMNMTTPLITIAKSYLQELKSVLFNIEEIHTATKLRYLYASIILCLIQFGNLFS